jgi:FlaA1/EpsC-like NDP-sugar epimerase
MLDQAETPLHHLSLEAESIVSSAKICNVVADIRNKEALSKVFKLYKPDVVSLHAYKHVPLMEENPSQAILTILKELKTWPIWLANIMW